MSTIVKVLSGTGHTKKGSPIPIYRIKKYRPDHPDYAQEVKFKDAFIDNLKKNPPTLSIFGQK